MTTGSHTHSHQVTVGGKTYTTNAKAHSHTETAQQAQIDALTARVTALEAPVVIPPDPIPPTPAPAALVGYGSRVTAGTGKATVRVTNLNPTGSGSLYEALQGNDRTIVFDVEGTIDTTRPGDLNQDGYPYEIELTNRHNVTIDGSSAPGKGITLTKYGIEWKPGCDNIIVRHLAFRDILGEFNPSTGKHEGGCLTFRGTKSFVVDHCSFSGFNWRGIDIVAGSADATVQWCFFGPYSGTGFDYQMHIAGQPNRISVDHTLFYRGSYRHPEFDYDWTDGQGPAPTDTTGDMANCLVYDDVGGAGHYGTVVQGNARVNLRQGYYHAVAAGGANGFNRAIATTAFPIIGDNGKVYKSGLASNPGTNLSSLYETPTPWAVPAYAVLPLEASALAAAKAVLAGAGRFPRDSVDAGFAAGIVLL